MGECYLRPGLGGHEHGSIPCRDGSAARFRGSAPPLLSAGSALQACVSSQPAAEGRRAEQTPSPPRPRPLPFHGALPGRRWRAAGSGVGLHPSAGMADSDMTGMIWF